MDTYLGLDFGGTKLLIGEMEQNGKILRSKCYATGYSSQEIATAGILQSLEDYKRTVGFEGTLRAAGIGIVGTSNCDSGVWISMNHIITGPPVPLTAMLEESLGIPCAIDNDVRSATTAELMLGKGKQSENFIYINVGTGLAAGFVSGGRIIRGANYNSGEIGHMVVDMRNRISCICGRTGCVENMLSGMGFTRQLKEYKKEEFLSEKGQADVVHLFEMADEGEETCVKITEYAADTLACIIMNLVRVTDPDTVILGGGVISDGWMVKKVAARLEPHTMRGVTRGVVLSSFPIREAGLIGAASLGLQKYYNSCI